MNQCGKPGCYIDDLHTHQTGTDGVIGQVCKHGSLARSCLICELEAERDLWKAKAETLAEALKNNHGFLKEVMPHRDTDCKICPLLAEFEKES